MTMLTAVAWRTAVSKQRSSRRPWANPPPKTARAVRVQGRFTLHMVALAPANRRRCAREERGRARRLARWRRQRLEQTRATVIVFAQGHNGLWHCAAYAWLVGVKRKDRPPGIGTCQDILAKYTLMTRR